MIDYGIQCLETNFNFLNRKRAIIWYKDTQKRTIKSSNFFFVHRVGKRIYQDLETKKP